VVVRGDERDTDVVRADLGGREAVGHARRLEVVIIVGGRRHRQQYRSPPVDARGGATVWSSHGEQRRRSKGVETASETLVL
jgi:hypothetical protein